MANYLPILDELCSSDTIILFMIGVAVGMLAALYMKCIRKNHIGMVVCFGVYALCEVISDLRISYLCEFIALFVGTLALGGVGGLALGTLILRKVK